MKITSILPVLALSGTLVAGGLVPFDLQPPGGQPGDGIGPLLVATPLEDPDAPTYGNEIESGIALEESEGNQILTLVVGYGESTGFMNLVGPATKVALVGPDPEGGDDDLISLDLEAYLFPNSDAKVGGIVRAMIEYSAQADEAVLANLMDGQHYLSIVAEGDEPVEYRGYLIALINTPPMVRCPDSVTAECESQKGTEVSVTVGVKDEDGDPLTVVWMLGDEEVQRDMIPASEYGPSGAQLTHVGLFPPGESVLSIHVSDGENPRVVCSTTVMVVDTTAPRVTSARAYPNILWPPNHKMRTVFVRVRAKDSCGRVRSKIVSVHSNEPVDGKGDGNTSPDWEILDDLKVNLRAERSGNGDGRVYTLLIETSDRSGNTTHNRIQVKVPHDQSSKTKKLRR